jgi:hypothetical protein
LNQTGSGISYPIVKEQNPLSSRKSNKAEGDNT